MGREAVVQAEVGSEVAEVRALLESTELILRGKIRRRFPRAALENLRAADGALQFTCFGETVQLYLGSRAAESWLKAIATPPPNLRAKLGLGKGAKAKLIGVCDDAKLAEALDGILVEDVREASMLIARIDDPNDLAAARRIHTSCLAAPIWAIYPKGKGVAFGDGEIRAEMRAAGFRDTKSCAVSGWLTATRYNLP